MKTPGSGKTQEQNTSGNTKEKVRLELRMTSKQQQPHFINRRMAG